ncbi:MAG: c-type cytochrome [Campylobacterota bacterium]|nr:c-type cytochrome [Campylobacterota bacterium]
MKKLLLLISSICFLFASQNHNMELGKKLYQDTCISCHGVDGKAKTDMQLIIKPRDLSLTLLTEEQTYQIIKHGAHYWGAKSDIMPAFKYVFNEEQLRSITHYITKTFNPNLKERIEKLCSQCEKEPINQDKKMKKWGKKIFKRNCSFCHGIEGRGDGVATTSPVDSIFPYDLTKTLLTKKQIFLYVKYGGKHFGTDKDDMPAWSKKYNDFRLHSIAKYIDEIIIKKD